MLALAREAGFGDVQHVPGTLLAERYFADRADGLRRSSGEDLLVATTSSSGDVFGREVGPGGGQEYHDIDRLNGKSSLDISPEDGLAEKIYPGEPVAGRQIGLHDGGRVEGDQDLAGHQRGQRAQGRAERRVGNGRQEQRDRGDAEHGHGDERA